MGLFPWEGRVIGLSGLFRFLLITLVISVENRVLEIAGLGSGSGLKISDFSVTMLFEAVLFFDFRQLWFKDRLPEDRKPTCRDLDES